MSVVQCAHKDQSPVGRACPHLLTEKDASYTQRFTGIGLKYDLICWKCQREADQIEPAFVDICSQCVRTIEEDGCWEGIIGIPEILTRESNLRLEHKDIVLPELAGSSILEVQPITKSSGAWLACTSTGALIELTPADRAVHVVAEVPQDALDFDGPSIRVPQRAWPTGSACMLRVSRRGELAAVANRFGDKGVVIDLTAGRPTIRLHRGRYHEDVSCFPLAFVEMDDRILLIHGTAWNRLDVSDARSGKLITERGPTSYRKGETRPEHYLDYFHCSLSVSPDQRYVADNGWVWSPFGVLTTWNLERWLHTNVWESEDGETRKRLNQRAYYWDGPLCWLSGHHLAVWGYGLDDEWLIPAVFIHDVMTGTLDSWFAGPKGSQVFDDYLFSLDKDEGMSVWDVETGERLLTEPGFCPVGYHRGARQFLSILEGGQVRLSHLVRG